jgi:hypothetical protein
MHVAVSMLTLRLLCRKRKRYAKPANASPGFSNILYNKKFIFRKHLLRNKEISFYIFYCIINIGLLQTWGEVMNKWK